MSTFPLFSANCWQLGRWMKRLVNQAIYLAMYHAFFLSVFSTDEEHIFKMTDCWGSEERWMKKLVNQANVNVAFTK